MEKLNTIIERQGESYVFVASSPAVDRAGDQVVQDFDLEKYLENPVVLFGHDHSDPVGKCLDARIEDGKLVAQIEFAPTPRGQEIKTLVDHGTLRALSIGFIPGQEQASGEGYVFSKNSLLEISIVPVPSNPEALRTKSEEEKTVQDTTIELKPLTAQPESLMAQIEKSMPSLMSGQAFKTEVSRKSIAGPINAGATTSLALPPQFAGLVNQTRPTPNRLYDLISKLSATGQSVNYVQVALSQNNAAIVPELGLKPESQLATIGQTVNVQTFAHWTEASKQVLSDVAGLQALIGGALIEGVIRIVDAHIYDTLTASASTFVPTTEAADVVAEATLRIQMAGGSSPIVAVNPSDYLAMMTAKASGSGEYLGLSQMSQSVIASPSVAVGKILAFDPSAACYFERETVGVFLGYSGDQFVRNALTVLAELRGVAAVLDPNLVMFGDLPPAKQATTVTAGETPPMNPLPNQLWFNSSRGTLLIYHDDGTSCQWVEIVSGGSMPAPKK